MSVDSSPTIPTVNVLSVCTGMYGLDLGFDIAAERCLGRPVRTVCGVEREAYCAEVLATRMEEAHLAPFPVWSNLKTFDGRPWRGVVDWVVGGYPCQPFSQAGQRKGVDDPRHLWPDIARVIGELGGAEELDGCLFENVRGHLTLGLDTVTGELRAMGFTVAAGLFSAEEVGASHRRERVFILAVRPGLVYADRLDQGRREEEEREAFGGVAASGAVGEPAHGSSVGSGQWERSRLSAEVETGSESRNQDGSGDVAYSERADERAGEKGSQEAGVGRRGFADEGDALADDDGCGQQGIGRSREDGTSEPQHGVSLFAPGPAAFDRWGEVLLRFRPELAPALPDPSDDLLQECEAEAQSELRRVVDGLAPRLERLRGLGNGVVPLEAAHAFSYLVEQVRTGGPLAYV